MKTIYEQIVEENEAIRKEKRIRDAAPELLSNLQDCATVIAVLLRSFKLDPEENETLQAARAAIAKATGTN